ncbi:MAG: hypothetical protein KAI99_12185, partial [Cyclobacteriaceae bacterium]|nr:hypothetical protein [Cyclobacteriaceae bacterium]
MLADGNTMIKFNIELQEGEEGRIFQFAFGVLNQCSLRVRLPLNLVDQNTWRMPRDGAFLKPMCWGDRVDLNKVDRMKLYINRKSEQTSRFCITSVIATKQEVSVIEHPVLPKGKLIDAIGQSTIHDWIGKTRSVEEMAANLRERLKNSDHTLPELFSKWGGWKSRRIDKGTGFFRVHEDENRWWFVDPEGYLFWSSGVDSVRVDTSANIHLLEDALEFLPSKQGEFAEIFRDQAGQMHNNYLAANYIRTFGKDGWMDKWATIALDELKRLRFNTVGNWSEWEYASKAGFSYVRPMSFSVNLTKDIYRDFPDVFHPDFEKDANEYAQTLSVSVNDPALIGYFMMNEPKWAFSQELPAVGMLYNTAECVTRSQLTKFLKEKYSSSEDLAGTWKLDVDFTRIEKGKWKGEFTKEALSDLEIFSENMVKKYFGILSKACKKVDPNHLNLGIRYAGVPPKWAVAGMKSFDVFSMNNYREKVSFEQTQEIHDLLQMPVIIGEWHFGALDVGLPSSGIGHVRTQEDRGKAYRVYFEDAAANPYCVGVHWFVLYDQSAIGRFDGENYNIGFLDICNQTHKPLCDAAIKSHEAVYDIADGNIKPYDDTPEYLPKLF